MKIALCNAVLAEFPFERQCSYAAELGYDGLEVVPATLADDPLALSAADCARFQRWARAQGIEITGLHRLLSAAPSLSIVTADENLHARTIAFLCRMVDVCAQLGGKVVVHGSPKQRHLAPGQDAKDGWQRARDAFAHIADRAAKAGIVYCIEPLPADETNFINTLDEAGRMVDEIGSPHLRTMIDAKSVLLAEAEPLPAIIDQWLPTGKIAHVQLNDSNRRAPGQGDQRFAPVIAALVRNGYRGVITVEPFVFIPDERATAARSIGYLRGLLESVEEGAPDALGHTSEHRCRDGGLA